MFFHLTELEHHPILFDVTYNPGEIEFGEGITQEGGLKASGSAELLRNTNGEIRIRGQLNVTLMADCDRCLEPARETVSGPFDLFFRPVIETDNHAEIQLEEGEIDLSFYEGDGVGLKEALREFVLLALPMQFVCREDCKGLCPVCGKNKNVESCSCVTKPVDERWAALKDL